MSVDPTHLAVTLRLHGAPVEHRVLPLRGRLRLGSGSGASVCFPGGRVEVRRDGLGRWRVGHRRLRPGVPARYVFGPVEVVCEGVVEDLTPRGPASLPDLLPVVATLAALLFALSLEVGSRVLHHNAEVAQGLGALLVGTHAEERVEERADTPDPWPPPVRLR